MAELLQHLVNGLVLGGTYALLGIGLSLIFGLMNVVNFAHGEFYTLGAYAAFAALAGLGAGFFPALRLAIAAGAAPGAPRPASPAPAAGRPRRAPRSAPWARCRSSGRSARSRSTRRCS